MDKEYEYGNLVKGYEKTIETQADMINRQQHFIKWLLVTFSSIIGMLCIMITISVACYFWAPYTDCTDNSINGNNVKNVSNNTMDNSHVEIPNLDN